MRSWCCLKTANIVKLRHIMEDSGSRVVIDNAGIGASEDAVTGERDSV